MKATEVKDLVVGKIYSDSPVIDNMTGFLRYEGTDSMGDPTFLPVGGCLFVYPRTQDGLIEFTTNSSPFYELTEEEIKQLKLKV